MAVNFCNMQGIIFYNNKVIIQVELLDNYCTMYEALKKLKIIIIITYYLK